jgi:uncharacterized protein
VTGLKIAPGCTLPLDAVTETFGILAKKGAGKSNAAVVMAEEMYDAGVPWVAIDPKGDWWGLRSSSDGQGAGLPIVVFGGRHGDVPLEPTAGALIADLVLEQNLTCVLDVSEFAKADVRRFLLAFADRLYRQAEADPIHLFLEEAHEYLPQRVMGEDAHLVNAWQRIVKQGRFKGLGCTLISQRSAALNKDVLTQVDTLIVLRTTSPQDRKAVRDWVDVHADAHDMLATLPSLESGEAWLWSPEFLGKLERIRFRRRRTFDSGATPKVGQKRRTPATLADVDLAAIKEQMAETIEKAKADDPKVLRGRIRDLEKQVANGPQTTEVRVEVPVLPDEVVSKIESTFDRLSLAVTEWAEELRTANDLVDQVVDQSHSIRALLRQGHRDSSKTSLPSRPRADAGQTRTAASTPASARRAPATRASTPPAGQGTTTEGDVRLGKTERTILAVLAEHGPRTHGQLALLSGYSPKASTIGVSLGKLRKAGYVADGQPITATQDGLDWLGDYEPLPTGQALIDYWRNKFGLTEQRVLDAVLSCYPDTTSQAEVAEITGYSPTASTIGVALGRLRKVGVIDGWRISDDFAAGAGLS